MKKSLFLFVIIFLMLSLIFAPSQSVFSGPTGEYSTFTLPEILKTAYTDIPAEELAFIENSMNLTHYDENKAMNGLTIFQAQRVNGTNTRNADPYLMIVDMAGNIRHVSTGGGDPELINSTTVMYRETDIEGIAFWNMESNVTEPIPLNYSFHHDYEYNPLTDTFLLLGAADYGEWDGMPIHHDEIYEVDRQNNTLWYWNGSIHIPWNPSQQHNDTSRGNWDWTHSNSIFWDTEHDIVYLNARHVDTFYAIDMKTDAILWSIGRLGSLSCYNKAGQQKETLFYHAHAVERISSNRFILFDNDLHNFSRANPDVGVSRLVEIEVNETAQTAREVWSWTPPGDYFCRPWGDADRLPNGNTLGTFGWGLGSMAAEGVDHPLYYTEVTPAGDIVWQLAFNRSSAEDLSWRGYRAERYFEQPLIDLVKTSIEIEEGDNATIELSTWNSYRERYHSNAVLKVIDDNTEKTAKNFQFLPYWQEKTLFVSVPALLVGTHNLSVVIENADGITAIDYVLVIVQGKTSESEDTGSFGITIASILAIGCVSVLIRRRKSN
ncbi:MAG: aryl-sulfate sulfotransferase [Candidatus Heimdallarchaeota archaeon]